MARVELQGFLIQYLMLHCFSQLLKQNEKLGCLKQKILKTMSNIMDFTEKYCVEKIILRVEEVRTFDADRHGNIGRKLKDERVFKLNQTLMFNLLLSESCLYKFVNWTSYALRNIGPDLTLLKHFERTS